MNRARVGCTLAVIVPLFVLVVFLYGLNPWFQPPLRALRLPEPNPTSYVFNTSIDGIQGVLRGKLVRCCGDAIEFNDDVLLSKGVLDVRGNENDAYIHNFHSPIRSSQVYFSGGHALPYLCEFHLHVTPISAERTEVKVFPLHAEVIAGLSWWGPHGSPANIYVSVAPTTIEEYKLLLEIGQAVGEGGMPQLILPDAKQTPR